MEFKNFAVIWRLNFGICATDKYSAVKLKLFRTDKYVIRVELVPNFKGIYYYSKTPIYRAPIYRKPRFTAGKTFRPNFYSKYFFQDFWIFFWTF